MSDPIKLTEHTAVARNRFGWKFIVAKTGTRWLGFAIPPRSPAEKAFEEEGLPVTPELWEILDVSEGFELGVKSKDRAILLAGAIAADHESSFGGVDEWFVPEALRGDPEKFRCKTCGKVGCNGSECQGHEDYGQEDF